MRYGLRHYVACYFTTFLGELHVVIDRYDTLTACLRVQIRCAEFVLSYNCKDSW